MINFTFETCAMTKIYMYFSNLEFFLLRGGKVIPIMIFVLCSWIETWILKSYSAIATQRMAPLNVCKNPA